jgi:hypothetical protein
MSRIIKLYSLLFVFFLSLVPMSAALAQSSDDSDAGGLAIFLVCCGIYFLIGFAILAWVWNDANKRGSNGIVWAFVVIIFNLLGLLAYLVLRPQGKLVPCPECGEPKPIGHAICPHCGRRVV